MSETTHNQLQRNALPVKGWLRRALFASLLWWVLTEGRPDGLWFLIPVLAGLWLAESRLPVRFYNYELSIPALLRFIPMFIYGSISGGFDVARRVLSPRMSIQPARFTYSMLLQTDHARTFLAQVISLMPGTLACDLRGGEIEIHALFGDASTVEVDLRRIERHAMHIFRENGEAA